MGDVDEQCDVAEVVVCSSNWSELNEDFLHQILNKFTSVSDCLRFGAVCVSWRNFLVPHIHPDLLNPQLPLLLIPTPPTLVEKEKEHEHEQTRCLYNVSEKRVYKDIKIKLPYNMHCRGSSHGWLIAAGFEEDTGYAVELINPLVSINNECMKIQLPPLTALPQDPDLDIFGLEYLPKVVLSDNPLTNPKDYVVMAIYGAYLLAYWKPNDKSWTPVPWSGDNGTCKWEILHHKGMYYIVSTQGKVFVCDLGSAGGTSSSGSSIDHDQPHRPIKVWKIASSPIPKHPGGIEKYLVKLPMSGDLIMVHRFHTIARGGVAPSPHSTVGFSAFKLLVAEEEDFSDDEEEEEVEEEEGEEGPYSSKWRLMSHLENQMFFVGDNASMSLPASEFPGGKPNHIYFTPDYVYDRYGYLDMGVFDYTNCSIEQIHPMGSKDYILPVTTIWVEPTLRCCLRF